MPFLKKNACFFFPFVGGKSKKRWTKSGKIINYVTFLMFSK